MKNTKQKHWLKEESEFAINSAGKLPIYAIAEQVHRSERAVKIYLLRHQVRPGLKVQRNIVLEMIKMRFGDHPEYFQPTRDFYRRVKIGQRRWGQLYSGLRAPRPEEILSVANELGVSTSQVFEHRQLSLFGK